MLESVNSSLEQLALMGVMAEDFFLLWSEIALRASYESKDRAAVKVYLFGQKSQRDCIIPLLFTAIGDNSSPLLAADCNVSLQAQLAVWGGWHAVLHLLE